MAAPVGTHRAFISQPGGGGTVGPWASSSFTPNNNSIIVVSVALINDNHTPAAVTVYDSLGTLTWHQVISSVFSPPANVLTCAELWWAEIATGASMTVSVSLDASVITDGGPLVFAEISDWTGIDTVGGPIGLTGSESTAQSVSWNAAISQTLGGTTASDSVVYEVLSADGRDFTTSAPNGFDIQAGTGYTELQRLSAGGSSWYRTTHAYKAGALSTYDFVTWQDNWGHASAGMEIKAASGSGFYVFQTATKAKSQSSSATSLTPTFAANLHTGGLCFMVFGGRGNSGSGVASVTDTASQTWTKKISVANSGNSSAWLEIWTAPVSGGAVGTAPTVTVNKSGGADFMGVQIFEVTGLDTSGSQLDASGTHEVGSATNPATGTATSASSASGEFVLQAAFVDGGTLLGTSSSGFTLIDTFASALDVGAYYKSSTISVSETGSIPMSSDNWNYAIGVWKLASGSTDTPINPPQGNVALSTTAPTVAQGLAVVPPQGNANLLGTPPSVIRTKNVSWEFKGVTSVVQVTATSHALSEPAGVQQGDLLVAVISSRIASTTSITLPSGGEWTLVTEQKNNNTLTTSSALPSGMMAYCVRGASAPNFTFTHPTAPSVALGRVVAYRGLHPTGLKDTQSSFTTAIATTAVSGAGLTTTAPSDLIIVGACGGQEAVWTAHDAVTDPTTSSGTNANQTAHPIAGTWQQRAASVTTGGADTSLAIADAIRATAGATGNLTATASVSAGHVIVAGAFELSFNIVIDVQQGDLVASPLAPTVEIAAAPGGSSVIVPQGNAALSPTAPTVARTVTTDISVPQGNLATSPTAPTVAGTAHRNITIGQGNAALSPTAPSISVAANRNIAPSQGNVILSPTAPTVARTITTDISVSQGNLATSPTAPTVARTTHRNIASPQGNIALSPTAPTIAQTFNRNITSPQGNVALSTNAPEVAAGAGVGKSPAARDLLLSPVAPTVARTDHRNLAIPQGNLATSPTFPTVARTANRDITVAQGNVTLSPTAPDVQAGAGVSKSPAAADLLLSATAPTVARSTHRDITVSQGNLATSPTAPSVSQTIVEAPAARDLVLSPTAPTVLATAHRNLTIAQANLALSRTAPARVVDFQRLPAVRDLLLSPTAPIVARTDHRNITVPQANAVLTSEAPSTGGAMSRLPLQGNLTLSRTAPTVVRTANWWISPAARDLTLSPVAPTIFASLHHPILVPQGDLALSTLPAQLIPGNFFYPLPGNLRLSPTTPLVTLERLRVWRRATSLAGQVDVTTDLHGTIDTSTTLRGNIVNELELEGG